MQPERDILLGKLSREARILLHLFRLDSNPHIREALESSLTGPIDWRRLLELADRHRLYPALCEAVVRFAKALVPQPVLAEMQEGRRRRFLLNRYMETHLVELSKAFREAEVPLVAFKGPVLDRILYGEHNQRQYGDLDILVSEDRVADAAAILKSMGYSTEIDVPEPLRFSVLRHGGEMLFCRPGSVAIEVDLHWRLFSIDFTNVDSLLGFWGRLQRVSLGGEELQTLGKKDLLVYLCHHNSKHLFENLGSVYEIAEMLQLESELDWKASTPVARSEGVDRALLLGPYLASLLLDAPVPATMLKIAKGDPVLGRLAERVVANIDCTAMPKHSRSSFIRDLWPAPRARLRRLAAQIFIPQVSDWRSLPLRPSLSFLYYIFRPARLLMREVLALARRISTQRAHPPIAA